MFFIQLKSGLGGGIHKFLGAQLIYQTPAHEVKMSPFSFRLLWGKRTKILVLISDKESHLGRTQKKVNIYTTLRVSMYTRHWGYSISSQQLSFVRDIPTGLKPLILEGQLQL